MDSLDVICDYFGETNNERKESFGLHVLRQIVHRYDIIGAFEAEFFEQSHYSLADGEAFIPENSITGPTTFRAVEEALDLRHSLVDVLAARFGALRQLDPQIRQLPEPRFGAIVFLYGILYVVQQQIIDYYRDLLQETVFADEAPTLRKAYTTMNSTLEKLPLLKLMKDAILGRDLGSYTISFGPRLRAAICK